MSMHIGKRFAVGASGITLGLAVLGWWAINVPYAAIGLSASGYPRLFGWIAALFLPLAGATCAATMQRLESAGRRSRKNEAITVLLLLLLAIGYADLSYPVGNQGRGPWFLPVFFGGLDVLFGYQVPRIIFAIAAEPAARAETTRVADSICGTDPAHSSGVGGALVGPGGVCGHMVCPAEVNLTDGQSRFSILPELGEW
jgi:hypothetical protein